MNLVNKDKPEYSVQLYLIFPSFSWRFKSLTFRREEQSSTKLELPVFFRLTNQENYFIVELSLVIGIGLKLITKER